VSGELLERLTWLEAAEALQRYRVVLIPLGARLKEHGPHLPLNNDWLMAEWLAARVVQRCEVLAAPTIQHSYYPALRDYPGTIHLRRETAQAVILDVVRSLRDHGGQRFYVLNTGISTNWALEPARQELQAEGVLLEYLDLTTAVREVEKTVEEQERGTHADELETSMMLYLAPEVVNMKAAVKDANPRRGKGPLTRDPAVEVGVYSPTGSWGDPTLATREKGELICEALVDFLQGEVATLAADDYTPPPPRERYLS
jgi:creatinine amidohydrolase